MKTNDREFIIQKIRAEYMAKDSKTSELEALRSLDAKIKRPANIFAYVFGSAGALVMGSGMSLMMTDIGETLGFVNTTVPAVIIGIIGMLMAIVNYPIFKTMLSFRKAKYADKILSLSEKMMKSEVQ